MITVVRSHQVASEWVVRVGLCHSPAGARDKDYRAGNAGGQHYCPQIFQGNLLVHLDGWIYMDGWMGCVSHLYRENLNVRGHGVSRVRPNIGDWPVGNSRIKSERRMLLSQEDNLRKGIFTSGYVLVSAPGACNWHR